MEFVGLSNDREWGFYFDVSVYTCMPLHLICLEFITSLIAKLKFLNLSFLRYYQNSNLHYARVITARRVTSGGARLRGLAPVQHISEEISPRCRAVVDTVTDLTGPGNTFM